MAKCKVCGYRLGDGVTKCPMCGATAGSTVAGEISLELNLPKYFCPSCNSQILGEHRYCPSCGVDLKEAAKKAETQKKETTEEKKCVKCGAVLTPNAKFCPECGAKQESSSVKQASKKPASSKNLKTESKKSQKKAAITTTGGLVNGKSETPMEAFKYRIEDGKYVLAGLKNKYKTQSKIVIPEIFYRIAGSAFFQNEHIETVVIKNGVKEIGSDAFWGCNKLVKIYLPDTIEVIESGAFSNCLRFTGLTLRIYNLFPASIKVFGKQLFELTEKVKLITSKCEEEDDDDYDYDDDCLDIENIDTLELPASLETIAEGALFPYGSLSRSIICNIKTLIIPESVKEIGRSAFDGFNIERVIIKNNYFNKNDVISFLGGYLPKELIIGDEHIEYTFSDKIWFRVLGR